MSGALHGLVPTLRPSFVLFDAASAVVSTATTSLSWTHTPAGPVSAIIVGSSSGNNSTSISSATYGGQAMTRIGSAVLHNNQTSGGRTEMFGLLNPPGGAQTVLLTYASTGGAIAASMSFNGVGSFGTATTAFAAINVSVSSTAAARSMIAHVAGWSNSGGNANALTSYSQTQRLYNRALPAAGVAVVGGTAAGTGTSVAFNTGIDNWCSAIAVVLNP